MELALACFADDVADVDALDLSRADVGVDQRLDRGFREQLRARALVLAELGHAEADDRDSPHAALRRLRALRFLA
jgi:hypothetical protein